MAGFVLSAPTESIKLSIEWIRHCAFCRITARGSEFNWRASLGRFVFLKLRVLFEAGTVNFPPGPRAAPSSRESNCAVLPTLIAAPVLFPLVTLPPDVMPVLFPLVTFPPDVTVAAGIGGSSNGGGVAPR